VTVPQPTGEAPSTDPAPGRVPPIGEATAKKPPA
jgi:hypothetical protein